MACRPKKSVGINSATVGRLLIVASAARRTTTHHPAPERYCIEMKSALASAIDSA